MTIFYPSLPALYILIAYFSAENMQLDFKGWEIDRQKTLPITRIPACLTPLKGHHPGLPVQVYHGNRERNASSQSSRTRSPSVVYKLYTTESKNKKGRNPISQLTGGFVTAPFVFIGAGDRT